MQKQGIDVFEILQHFVLEGDLVSFELSPNGRINDTFIATIKAKTGLVRYYVQRINKNVFKNPAEVMDNTIRVSNYLKRIIVQRQGDSLRETLTFRPVRSGGYLDKDKNGDFFRVSLAIENSITYNEATPELFEEAGCAFGRFQHDLRDFDSKSLYETIKGFHDTGARFEALKDSIQADTAGRAASIQEDISFALAQKDLAYRLLDLVKAKTLPLRVTHNDTKLNNVLMDAMTGKGLCVIDLDTVMPGLAANDFGDAVRYGANTACEDERDLAKVSLDLVMFEAFAKGFLRGLQNSLTKAEVDSFVDGAMTMAFELGIRFLKDYLDGDVYFRADEPDSNLVRARVQFALLKDMMAKESQMRAIIAKYNR